MSKSLINGGLAYLKKLDPAWANALLDLIYPENLYCACCGDAIERTTRIHCICDKCAGEINWINDNPFESSMDDFSFDALLACCIYGYLPRQIIHKLKLGGRTDLAKPVGRLMAERVRMEGDADFDEICFIPSSREKLQKRGYNQAQLLAKEVSRRLGIPLAAYLIKPAETASMRLSSGEERRTMLEGAFAVDPEKGSPKNKKILLVDDVLTTGSTANEAARILKIEGAKSVCVLVFASSAGNRRYGREEESDEPGSVFE